VTARQPGPMGSTVVMGDPSKPAGPPGATGVDLLSQNSGEMTRRAQSRDLAASIVTALFRLVKLSTLHSLDNQAMKRQVEETVVLVNDYGQRTEHNVSILFAHGSVFVGGLLLRANRGVYEGALELGEILAKVGAAEIGIMRDARESDFYAFASALADSLRSAKPSKIERPSPKIRLRGISAVALNREHQIEQRLDPNLQVARTYASAVVIMRRFFEDLRRGKYDLPQRVKRVAQRLVDLSTGETPAFLGVTAARNANHDQAGRAVNTAILSLGMMRQITPDVVMLSRVAMAALLFDTARARIAGAVGRGGPAVMPQLSEQQENESPAGTAVVLTALGRVNEPSVMRTVMAYEAHWVRRRERLGPVYRGLRQPSMQSRIISVARVFNDMLTPSGGQEPPPADQAIAMMEQGMTEAADRTALRLLVGALGIFPTGTIVELSTGETALVVQTPGNPSLYSQPRVRVVVDAHGGTLNRPIDVDLAVRKRGGEPPRFIKRVVATSDDPSAASLRAFAAQAVAPAPAAVPSIPPPDPYAQPAPLPGGRRATFNSSISHATPAPSSINTLNPTPGPHSPRVPTLESHVARRDAGQAPAPPTRPLNVQVIEAPLTEEPDELEQLPDADDGDGAYGDNAFELDADEGEQRTRAVSWEEQAQLIAPTRVPEVEEEEEPPALPEEPEPPPAALAPTAEGSFTKTPLVNLLIYMLDQGLTGTTIIHAPDGIKHEIFFHAGAPSKVRTGAMVAPLDRILLELGFLDETTLRGTLMEISKKQVLHGRHLVMKGLLDREKIIAALRTQVLRKITYLGELPDETTYAYYEGVNFLSSYGGPELTPCEPLASIMAGIRLRANDPRVDATLARIANRPLGLHPEADMRRFELQRDERGVIDLLRARKMTLTELLDAGVAQERIVRLTIYALAMTRHLDLGVPGRAPVGAGRTANTQVIDQSQIGVRELPSPTARSQFAPPAASQKPAAPPAARRQPTMSGEQSEPSIAPLLRQQQAIAAPPDPGPARFSTGRAPTATPPTPAVSPPAAQRPDAPAWQPPIDVTQRPQRKATLVGAPNITLTPNPPGIDPAMPPAARPTTKMRRVQMPGTPASPEPHDEAPVSSPGTPPPVAARPPAPPQRHPTLVQGSTAAPAARPAPPAPAPPPPPARQATFAPPTPPPTPARQTPPPALAAAAPPPARQAPPPPPSRQAPPPAPSAPTPPPTSAPAAERSDIAARRAEIEKRLATIETEDYFQVLGVSREATSQEIQNAYFALAKAWHPDRLPPELADLKSSAQKVMSRVNEARQTLVDTGKRREYLEKLAHGGGASDDDEKIARVVDAAMEFQKAEILLKKNDLAGAEALASRAAMADPEQPDYLTLLVWIQSQRRGDPPPVREGQTSPHFDDLIKTLDGILAKEPRYERALYYRGELLMRTGRTEKAIRDFRTIAETNPKHTEALRYLRIHEMRKRSGGDKPAQPPNEGGGLFGKFFKR
jgi:DnaJ-domain-containing protein 1